MNDKALPGIDSLLGESLSGVAFVQDYVEFHFDGRILRALTNPSVTIEVKSYKFPLHGSRDALCMLIGRIVNRVYVKDEYLIAIRFTDNAVLEIPLQHSERKGPEAAHFVPGTNQPIDVW